MGNVDLHFKPTVPVFDANVALGRRHDRRVRVDTVDGTIKEMDRAGVQRALVYAPHGASYDSPEGNQILLDQIKDEPRLVPQFCCNPALDDLDLFAEAVREAGVRSIRVFPKLHNYPFREWVLGPWLDWAAGESIAIWVPMFYDTNWHDNVTVDPSELHDTVKARPDVTVVLSEVKYADYPWTMPLLRSVPNVHIEISRFFIIDGIGRLIRAAGEERILFGSSFPDSPMGTQLYSLHRNGLSEDGLAAICAGNLDRLLGGP